MIKYCKKTNIDIIEYSKLHNPSRIVCFHYFIKKYFLSFMDKVYSNRDYKELANIVDERFNRKEVSNNYLNKEIFLKYDELLIYIDKELPNVVLKKFKSHLIFKLFCKYAQKTKDSYVSNIIKIEKNESRCYK